MYLRKNVRRAGVAEYLSAADRHSIPIGLTQPMTNTVDGNRQLEGSLHNDPAAYWCPRCWQFMKGCEHLVPSLKKRRKKLPLNNVRILSHECYFSVRKMTSQIPSPQPEENLLAALLSVQTQALGENTQLQWRLSLGVFCKLSRGRTIFWGDGTYREVLQAIEHLDILVNNAGSVVFRKFV